MSYRGGKFTRGKAVGSRPYGKLQIPKYLTCLANPFDPRGFGARIPDASTIPSQSFYALDTAVMSTSGTNGVSGMMAIPNLQYIGASATSASTSSWTWGAAFASNAFPAAIYSNATANYSAVRPVANAVKLTCVQNVTAAQGTLHVCYCPLTVYSTTTWLLPTSLSLMQRQSGYKRFPLSELTQKPLTLVNRPMDITSQRYQDPNDMGITQGDRGEFNFPGNWCALVFVVEGASSSDAVKLIEVEFLTHYEGIVDVTAGTIVPTSQAAEAFNPTVIGVATHQIAQQRIDEPTYGEESGDWDQIAVKALDAFEGAVGGAGMGYRTFGIPGAVIGGAYGAARAVYRKTTNPTTRRATKKRKTRQNKYKHIGFNYANKKPLLKY